MSFESGKTVARGFALYVGLDEVTAHAYNLSLGEVVTKLKANLDDLIPNLSFETFAAVALAPADVAGKNLDVVRTALGKPVKSNYFFVMDFGRKEVYVNGTFIELSWRELELLKFFADNAGDLVTKQQIGSILWPDLAEVEYQPESIKTALCRMWQKLGVVSNSFFSVYGKGYVFQMSPDYVIVNDEDKEKA
jgi:DNA-binding winged helix-turn-helix (wHTH) protein